MQVNLKQLQTGTGGQTLELEAPLDLSDLRIWGQRPFEQPVHIRGSVREMAGILKLEYCANYVLDLPCARCLCPVAMPMSQSFSHILSERVEDEEKADSIVPVPGGVLNFEELVRGDLCLELPPVVLCAPDCKGLCPRCGANRNDGVCECRE